MQENHLLPGIRFPPRLGDIPSRPRPVEMHIPICLGFEAVVAVGINVELLSARPCEGD